MNDARTNALSCAETVPGKSPHRYEVVGKYGDVYGPFHNVIEAYAYADAKWPDEEQDEERSGKGWDIAVVGADR